MTPTKTANAPRFQTNLISMTLKASTHSSPDGHSNPLSVRLARWLPSAPWGCSMCYHIGRSSQGLAPSVPDSSATSNLPS